MHTIQLSETQWRTLEALVRAVMPPLDANAIFSETGFTTRDREQALALSPISHPNFRPEIGRVLSTQRDDAKQKLGLVLSVLSYRALAFPLTGSPWLITEMSPQDSWQVIDSWRQSSLQGLREFAAGLVDLSVQAWLRVDSGVLKALGYIEPHPWIEKLKSVPQWDPPITPLPAAPSSSLPAHLGADVVIVGSGSSAGVAAYQLAKEGYSVLILEKGKHYSLSEIGQTDFERERQAFENEGFIVSGDSSMSVLAGATVGGGGAVNWSCSLPTPLPIREEFARLGAPLFGTREFDDAIESVCRVMGVTTDIGVPHSFTNQLILDSCRKSGYSAGETGQNTGKHLPNTHFLGYGQRHGSDKGGFAEWLRFAVDHGAQIIDECEVISIRHQNGYATGINAVKNQQRLIVNAKRVVIAGGSLQTPLLLLRSGFKNKHIGRHLKLHPVTVSFGLYPDADVNREDDPIMTAVSTQSDNLDGQFHGPKIEAIHHLPALCMKFLPYRSPTDWRRLAAEYRHLSLLLVITRDKGEGQVTLNRNDPFKPYIDYATSEYDLWALLQGCLTGADIHYVGGAYRIVMPLGSIPDFISSKPKSERNVWDVDYRNWRNHAAKSVFRAYDVGLGSAHQMGTCRMSSEGPTKGAVDARGRLYECSNVHVIDTSIFPAASGVNPMITCLSAASVLTKYIAEDLSKSLSKL